MIRSVWTDGQKSDWMFAQAIELALSMQAVATQATINKQWQ
jgi:hypothetical protein